MTTRTGGEAAVMRASRDVNGKREGVRGGTKLAVVEV